MRGGDGGWRGGRGGWNNGGGPGFDNGGFRGRGGGFRGGMQESGMRGRGGSRGEIGRGGVCVGGGGGEEGEEKPSLVYNSKGYGYNANADALGEKKKAEVMKEY